MAVSNANASNEFFQPGGNGGGESGGEARCSVSGGGGVSHTESDSEIELKLVQFVGHMIAVCNSFAEAQCTNCVRSVKGALRRGSRSGLTSDQSLQTEDHMSVGSSLNESGSSSCSSDGGEPESISCKVRNASRAARICTND